MEMPKFIKDYGLNHKMEKDLEVDYFLFYLLLVRIIRCKVPPSLLVMVRLNLGNLGLGGLNLGEK